MMFIWLKNKGNFESVASSTPQKFAAVIQPNKPWPARSHKVGCGLFIHADAASGIGWGLRQKSSLAALKRTDVERLRCARFAWRINDFFQQRNALELANST